MTALPLTSASPSRDWGIHRPRREFNLFARILWFASVLAPWIGALCALFASPYLAVEKDVVAEFAMQFTGIEFAAFPALTLWVVGIPTALIATAFVATTWIDSLWRSWHIRRQGRKAFVDIASLELLDTTPRRINPRAALQKLDDPDWEGEVFESPEESPPRQTTVYVPVEFVEGPVRPVESL